MAEEQKPVEVPKDTQEEPTAAPAPEAKPVEDAPAENTAAAKAEDQPAEAAADESKEAAKEDGKAAKPIEEGHLSHKAQGLGFPKNLIPSKEFFFFRHDAVEPKKLAAYKRVEKSIEAAHHNIAWAAHTGKGLLFHGDKQAPNGVINLSDASEPQTEGTHKFHLTSKGNRHTFKAASPSERDNWVAKLKVEIAHAKDMAKSVTESDTYKKTFESFKHTLATKKDVKPVQAPNSEEGAKTEEPAKEGEAAKEEPKEDKKDEPKAEEPKRRSASRKRASFFAFGNKKDEAKEEPKKAESNTDEAAVDPPAVETTKPEEAKPEEAKPADGEAATEEDKPAEEAPAVDRPTDKTAKRNSFFGGVFSKKEKKPAEAAKEGEAKDGEAVEEAPAVAPVVAEAPADAPSTDNAGVEAKDTANDEVKKDPKEKRKSSLPFAFGKREKSPAPADGEEKPGKGAFSKLRATMNRKASAKADDKPAEEAAKDEATVDGKKDEAPAEVAANDASAQPSGSEIQNAPENVAASAPAVTAAA